MVLSWNGSLTVGSKQKIKMETQNIMASLYSLKVSSSHTGVFHCPLVWLIGFSIMSPCWVKSISFTVNSNLIILVNVQRLHENGK